MSRGRFGRVVGCSILCTLLFHVAALPAGRPQVKAVRADVVPGVVIVAMQEGVSAVSASAQGNQASVRAFRHAGVLAARQMFAPVFAVRDVQRAAAFAPLGRIFECTIPADADPRAVAAQLARSPGVAYAEPKYLQTLQDIPNDPGLTNQNAAFTRMNAFAGYTIAKGSSSVLIATVDGGTYWRHEDLLPNVRINSTEDVNHNGVFDAADNNGIDDDANGFIDDVVGWNFTNGTNDPTGLASMPRSSAHGTATASHFGAASNNGVGMAGSSWNCALLPVCVASTTTDDVLAYGYEGIVYAAARGAAVINCSWGRLGGFSRFEQDVITSVTNGGALVVAAAGNDGANADASPHYPSCYTGVLAVGATLSSGDALASFSNYGTNIPVYAPGVSIWCALTNGSYGSGNGTSYSSPLVAGLAGILKAAHPAYTPTQIAAQIRATADPIESVNPGYAGMLGKGRVNFARALSENIPAVAVIASAVRASDGRSYFIPGDTILFNVTLRNPLFLSANNITFSSTSSSALVTPMDVPGAVTSLAPEQSVQLASFRFTVGAVSAITNTVLRVRWSIDGGNSDGVAVPVKLFPTAPQWIMQVDGGDASLSSVHAVNSSIVWVSGGSGTGSLPMVLRSTDGGATWLERTGDLSGVDLYCVCALDANRAWVGTGNGKIFATTNAGANWVQQSYPSTQSPFIDGIRMFDDGTGYALGDPDGTTGRFIVLKTTDFGGTWAHTLNEPQGATGEAGWNNSFWWTDARHGWFGTNKSKVWRTTNGGTTWSSAAIGSANTYGVSFRDTLTGYAIHDAGYIARSTNGGQTWVGIATPTTSNITAAATAPGSPAVWVSTAGNLFHSRNEGGAWATEAMYPFIGSLNHVSFVDTSTGWVVTSYGEVLKYSPLVVTGVGERAAEPLPSGYAMLGNYPNPFNGSSRIVYALPGAAAFRVTVRVFDLLGREIGLLANGVQEPGEHSVEFNARGHASGMYLCVLDAVPVAGGAGFRLTRSMILLR
jgi:subtilisin family serine protease/photosystem II stability/assembly factor-like uncharacterized protein